MTDEQSRSRSRDHLSLDILMPVLDGGSYVEGAVSSVLEQLAADDRLLVQDGGSRDGTLEVLERIRREDPRLDVESSRDEGQADALNRALSRSTADYVGWLNADDLLLPGALEHVRKAAASGHPRMPDVVTGWNQVRRADGTVVRSYQHSGLDRLALFKRGCYIFSGATFFKREVLSGLGGYAMDLQYAMDFDLLLRVASLPFFSQILVPHYLAAFRWHPNSKSGRVAWQFVPETWRSLISHAKNPQEKALAALHMLKMSAAIALRPVRHSMWYSAVRGRVKVWKV